MCDLSFSAGGIVTGCIFADVTSSAEFGDFLAFSSLIAGGTFAVVADNQIWSGTTYVGFGINVAGGTVTGNVFGGGGGADNPHFVYNAINIDPGSVVANEVYCLLDETVANGAAAIQTQTATVSANTVVLDQSSSGCCILASYFGVAVTGNSVTMQQVNAAEGIVAAWYGATVTGNAVVMGNATSQIGIHLTVDSVSCAADLNTIDTFFGITPQPTQDDGATNYVGPGNIVYDF
jgi:hypothetical protein